MEFQLSLLLLLQPSRGVAVLLLFVCFLILPQLSLFGHGLVSSCSSLLRSECIPSFLKSAGHLHSVIHLHFSMILSLYNQLLFHSSIYKWMHIFWLLTSLRLSPLINLPFTLPQSHGHTLILSLPLNAPANPP